MRKRILSFVLCLLMLCTLLPQPLAAAQTVYFTSVNDMLLDLNDETMPFWQGSTLYVPSTVFDRNKTDLGTTYSRSRDKLTAIIYRNRDVLVFDLAAGTIENNSTHEVLSGSAVVRGDVVFFPVNTVAKFFEFDYSCVKIDYGYLVRVKNDAVVLSDSAFIDAAAAPMTQRYNQYVKAHTSAAENQNGENGNEVQKGTAYLLVDVTNAEATDAVLAALTSKNASATFIMSENEIEQMPNLVRHIIVSGSVLAVKMEGRSANAAISDVEQANQTLWTVSNMKTRFVFTEDDTLKDSLFAAGYCPLSPALTYPDGLPISSRVSNKVSAIIGSKGRCIAYLGADTAVQSMAGSLVSFLRTNGCGVQCINEIAALS